MGEPLGRLWVCQVGPVPGTSRGGVLCLLQCWRAEREGPEALAISESGSLNLSFRVARCTLTWTSASRTRDKRTDGRE